MALIPCAIHVQISSSSRCFSSFLRRSLERSRSPLRSPFLPLTNRLRWRKASVLTKSVGLWGSGGARCWFKFGNRGVDAKGAGIYGSQSRDDFDRDDVEQVFARRLNLGSNSLFSTFICDVVFIISLEVYFNYMGMLAVEGSYDKMEALLNLEIHPVDILLMLAASEGDKPKIEELLRAGAKYDVEDVDGRTALDRASLKAMNFFLKLVQHYNKYTNVLNYGRPINGIGCGILFFLLSILSRCSWELQQEVRMSFSFIFSVVGFPNPESFFNPSI
ncbi:Protein LHCP translocation defect [Apostasia shenzhenica]|uniref:Protein LHCP TRANSLOCATION DEFECT n=1 Tax=Apostasia shenzhenica TaxID=1088818 RepID=A0A2I0AAM4_9ASPA|nr:Protein LHCP translocation defect [Apostasia shenzhenica]